MDEMATMGVKKSISGIKVIRGIRSTIYFIFLLCFAFAFLGPFLWMVITTFKPQPEIFSRSIIPSRFTLENITNMLSMMSFFRNFMNSVIVGGISTSLNLFFCSLAGFAFAKYDFPLKSVLFVILLSTLMIPFHVILVPLFMMMVKFGWVDNYLAMIVPFSASAFGIFFVRQYTIDGVPTELLDAARIDGCSEFGLYYRIVLPLVKPALGVLTIFIFMGSWNNFLWPLIVLKTESKYTLPLGLASLLNAYELEYGPVMAGGFLAAIPVIAVFLVMQKQFIRGLTLGAVKG
ncbi:MAG: carbohydrate ABC transporter permease [bacterium]